MNKNDFDENTDDNSENERIEQLLKANERLQQELASTQQQLASSLTLHASLAQQQAGDALVSFGEGVERRWLNARSIRALSLSRGMTAQPTYVLMVDELQVTGFMEAADAEAALDEVAEALNRILQPPER